ncbi:M30 family zinc metallopeptidase [Treponema sp.]|uniref:M30 family zinc metallopeptidase n=1 Tax=Treponema sp. TaxID=166 RepID=UPI003FD82043
MLYKKNLFFAVFATLFFSSCDLDFNLTTETTPSTVSWDASQSDIFELSADVTTVNISNATSGKTLYFVRRNTGSQTISSTNTRTLTAASQRQSSSTSRDFLELDEELPNLQKGFAGCFIPEQIDLKNYASSARLASVSSEPAISAKVGETKNIYVDNNTDISNFVQKSATLRAVGTYCYVWVVDDFYSSTAAENKVDSAIAQKYADAFGKMYPMITNVFGKESDKIYYYKWRNMENYSSTGTKINIVVYDIGNDYSLFENQQCGIIGYFYAKDYFFNYSKDGVTSNNGKYFYIDSGYANSNFDTTISTLAHEFQHMVNYNQKTVLKDLDSGKWYNEMLSMLCEDMMQEYLEIKDEDSPKARTKVFNEYYYYSGISEYNSKKQICSYATAFSFGSFIARNFGGAELVQKISQNSYVDNDSITNAVNSLNGTKYTYDDLFEKYLLSLFGNSTYTHNKDARCTLKYNFGDNNSNPYEYPMTAYNIFKYSFSVKGKKYYGPAIFKYDAKSVELRAENGILIHRIGTFSSSSLSVSFSSGTDSEKIYLIIR